MDKHEHEKRGRKKPRDQNNLDSQFADRPNAKFVKFNDKIPRAVEPERRTIITDPTGLGLCPIGQLADVRGSATSNSARPSGLWLRTFYVSSKSGKFDRLVKHENPAEAPDIGIPAFARGKCAFLQNERSSRERSRNIIILVQILVHGRARLRYIRFQPNDSNA